VAVAGRCTLDGAQLAAAGFDAVFSLLDEADSVKEAFQQPGPLLRRIGERVAERYAGQRAERVDGAAL
jgi:glycerate kinase